MKWLHELLCPTRSVGFALRVQGYSEAYIKPELPPSAPQNTDAITLPADTLKFWLLEKLLFSTAFQLAEFEEWNGAPMSFAAFIFKPLKQHRFLCPFSDILVPRRAHTLSMRNWDSAVLCIVTVANSSTADKSTVLWAAFQNQFLFSRYVHLRPWCAELTGAINRWWIAMGKHVSPRNPKSK